MLNTVNLIGRLTSDPGIRRTQSGVSVASFSLAVDRDFAEKGEDKTTDFIDCVAWRQSAEYVEKYLSKGNLACVSGRLQIRNWQDKDGNKRRTAEVVAYTVYGVGNRKDESDQAKNPVYPSVSQAQETPKQMDFKEIDDNDPLPF